MKMSRSTGPALACALGCLAAALPSAAQPRYDSAPAAVQAAPGYNKVVLVIEENQQYETIIGSKAAPYTNALARAGALLTTSYGTEHPSQPNYLDLFSGSDQNVYDDNHIANTYSTENLGAQLIHQGYSFAGFSEDLPYVGDTTDDFGAAPGDVAGTHDYARKHNPWANWQNDQFPATTFDYGSNYLPSSVNQTLAPWTQISQTGNFQQLPTVSVVVPNQQHDDHGVTGGASGDALIAAGDAWLRGNVGAYARWAAAHNSLLIVTWDEDDYSSVNHIATIFYGAHIKPGRYGEPNSTTFVSVINADNQPSGPPQYQPVQGVNHWNVLRTIEDIYRLGHIGGANKVAPITDIFTTH